MKGKKSRWVNYECLKCGRTGPNMKKQKSGIIVCPTCGYPVKKLRRE